jgi:hypothetical protein
MDSDPVAAAAGLKKSRRLPILSMSTCIRT